MEVVDVAVLAGSSEDIVMQLTEVLKDKNLTKKEAVLIAALNFLVKEKSGLESTVAKQGEEIKELKTMVRGLQGRVDRMEEAGHRHDIYEAKLGILVRGVGNLGPDDRNGSAFVEGLCNMGMDTGRVIQVKRMRASKIMEEKANRDDVPTRAPILLKFPVFGI
jgi:hypothetical protein